MEIKQHAGGRGGGGVDSESKNHIKALLSEKQLVIRVHKGQPSAGNEKKVGGGGGAFWKVPLQACHYLDTDPGSGLSMYIAELCIDNSHMCKPNFVQMPLV